MPFSIIQVGSSDPLRLSPTHGAATTSPSREFFTHVFVTSLQLYPVPHAGTHATIGAVVFLHSPIKVSHIYPVPHAGVHVLGVVVTTPLVTVITFFHVELPALFPTVYVAVYDPGEVYVCVFVPPVELVSLSPKLQNHAVVDPVVLSVNVTTSGAVPSDGFAITFATGGFSVGGGVGGGIGGVTGGTIGGWVIQ